MNTKWQLLLSILLLPVLEPTFAIDAVYDGSNGIREQIFANHCLFCHSSSLSPPSRNGAPPTVNFDSYEAALQNASRAIVRAVQQMTMPPAFSNVPTLNEEERNVMLAWESAGFPSESARAEYVFDTMTLTLPAVNVGEQLFNVTFSFTSLPDSQFGIGFLLNGVMPVSGTSPSVASFMPETGTLVIPEIELTQNGISQGRVSAELSLLPGTEPLLFVLTTFSVLP